MRRVIIESPFAGSWLQRRVRRRYARACLKDSLRRGEAPFASHLLYTQVLNDNIPEQRRQGIEAGQAWLYAVEAVAVYIDLGVSPGMMEGIDAAEAAGLQVEYRALDPKHQLMLDDPLWRQ